MANNDNNRFYLLQYTHEKIQALLKKIDDGWVLNEADYNQLINIIGLDNISTFSGWYDDLQGKPNLTGMIEETVNNINVSVIQNLRDFVLEQDLAIINELDLLAKEVDKKASKVDLSTGLAQKSDIYHNHDLNYAIKDLEHDHDNKVVIDSITEDNLINWTETGLKLVAFKTEVYDTFVQLIDLVSMLERKADVVHFHDAQYASKSSEHTHSNLDLLNAITLLDITNWNQNLEKTDTLMDLSEMFLEDIGKIEQDIIGINTNGVTKTELATQLLNYAKLTEMRDHVAKELEDYYNKANIDTLLDLKVDKVEGKELSDNNLTDELYALLLEIINDQDNTDKTVNEFVLDRIDNALADPDSELSQALESKVNKEDGKGLSSNDLTDELKALLDEILNGSDVDGNGTVSVLDYINKAIDDDIANKDESGTIGNLLDSKVDKDGDKVLSENDFTDIYKALLDEVLGAATSTDVTDFVKNLISQSILEENNNDDAILTIGEALLNKVDKDTFKTLEKDSSGPITVVADDEANFNASTMIKESDAKLINPDFAIGDKLAEVDKEMGLSEVPFTEEQNNFLNQVMREGATNDEKVKAIITDSINAMVDDGSGNMIPEPGSINEAIAGILGGDSLANKVDKAFKADGTEKVLSENDFTDELKEKLNNIRLIEEPEIDDAFRAAGFNI